MSNKFDQSRIYSWLGAVLVFGIILGSGILLVKTGSIESFEITEPDSSNSVEVGEVTEILGEKMINLNEAGLDQLETLEGIGPATAQKIIDYRDQNGRFKTKEEIMDVPGIGTAKFEKIKDEITL